MASHTWDPKAVLKLNIHDDFRCVGKRQDKEPCTQQIGKIDRAEGKRILQTMSAVFPNSSDFEDELDDLADTLLCSKSKHRESTEQHDTVVKKWKYQIREFLRKGGDTVMGEASDKLEHIQAQIEDLKEVLARLTTD